MTNEIDMRSALTDEDKKLTAIYGEMHAWLKDEQTEDNEALLWKICKILGIEGAETP